MTFEDITIAGWEDGRKDEGLARRRRDKPNWDLPDPYGADEIYIPIQVVRAAVMAQPIFEQNSWTYGHGETAFIPDVDYLTETIYDLFKIARDEKTQCGTGRFWVWWDEDMESVLITLELGEIQY